MLISPHRGSCSKKIKPQKRTVHFVIISRKIAKMKCNIVVFSEDEYFYFPYFLLNTLIFYCVESRNSSENDFAT